MAKLLKLRRGTTSQHSSFTGAEGECTVDTTKDTLIVHDGSTAGGRALLREDLNNIAAGAVTHAMLAGDAVDGDNIGDDVVNSEHIAAGAIDLEHMSSQSVDEDNLHVSNAPTNGYVLTARSGNAGGLTWEESAGGSDPTAVTKALGYESPATVPSNWTIAAANNAMFPGPMTVANGVTITLPANRTLTVV